MEFYKIFFFLFERAANFFYFSKSGTKSELQWLHIVSGSLDALKRQVATVCYIEEKWHPAAYQSRVQVLRPEDLSSG